MAARPGMWDQLPCRITASQRMLRPPMRRRQSWLPRPRQWLQRLPRPPRALRPPEGEEVQQPEQEPRSCCRRHSV